jgi:myo-inositol 2-dehydrogenase / D-chiro-inositol 1-dehydrogenase
MTRSTSGLSRRNFLKGTAAATALFTIVPRHVLGQGQVPPSETVGACLIGCGGRGGGTFGEVTKSFEALGKKAVKLADCDVRFVGKADNQKIYTDFRRVLERKDIEVVAIATPPHWHALITIAAMEAGKDVLCEKPMTRFIAEGRAVVNAAKRYGRIFQVGTFGRFGISKAKDSILKHKIMRSGLLKNCQAVCVRHGGFKVKEWSGKANLAPQPVPAWLDWDLYCGPSPLKPFTPLRHGGTHRWFWDYEGGGLADMGQHNLDPINWLFGKDDTSPVEIEAYAPPAHPEVTGMWGWSKLKYADGFTLVLESAEWGEPSGAANRDVRLSDLSEEDQAKLKAMPDPEPLKTFAEAVVSRQPAGGTHPEAAHRTACLMHLTNIAIRTGRKLKYDPVQEVIVGDDEANRLAYQPMRAPWHL